MLQAKQQQFLVTVSPTKRVADLVVSISIPFAEVCGGCLKRLKTNCMEEAELMQGSEEASILYAQFEVIRDKLTGSALEVFKTKVSNIDCHSIDGYFVITFNTQPTGTSLRKTCGLALSCLNPAKLFSKYTQNIKFLGAKSANRETFNFVANKLMQEIKKSITITAVGKINTDKDKLNDITTSLTAKIPELMMASSKETQKPEKRHIASTASTASAYPTVKCSGLGRAILVDYIRNNAGGMSVGVNDDGIVIYSHGWHAKHKHLKDKKRIQDYIHKKYMKLEQNGELAPLFAYFSLTEGFINAVVAEKILKSKFNTDQLVELLEKAL